ncbi:MAG: hypothetical protein HKO57_00260 [Akkermansiaceae bacterium]|nr:hypothetical protein [Akkermansiaceae bacterium]
MRSLVPWFLLMLPALAPAQEEEPAPPPKHVLQTALEWMQSPDPARRQAAYRSVHLFGKEGLPLFEKALAAALRHHDRRLNDLLDDPENPYRRLGNLAEELKSERARVLTLVRTDWKKDPGEIRMLRDEVASVERLYRRAVELAATDPGEIDQRVDAIATALVELHREIALFNADEVAAADTPPGDLKRLALEESFDGETYLEDKARFAAMQAEVERLAAISSGNDEGPWTNAPQKQFALLLNGQRAVMGLLPLRLEERLSAAATGHSRDMRAHGFFAHISPVEGKRSPADRARAAGFKGGWSGENIFMGSPGPDAAYDAWFASDGHRFIMFANGPNVLGLGPVGSHWTLMTGRN